MGVVLFLESIVMRIRMISDLLRCHREFFIVLLKFKQTLKGNVSRNQVELTCISIVFIMCKFCQFYM